MKAVCISVVNLTQDYMTNCLSKLLGMESNWKELGEHPWNENNFLLDLPCKWELSFAAEYDGEILGYIIGSKIEEGAARVNKIVVRREYRRNNIGTTLIKRFEETCIEKGLHEVDLKTIVDNIPAKKFYTQFGYQKQDVPVKGTDGIMRNVYRKRLK